MYHPSNPCLFATEPLDRASVNRANPDWVADRLKNSNSVLIPLFEGDPLMIDEMPAFLSVAALSEFGKVAPVVFLGEKSDVAYFAIDASGAPSRERAPFSDMGQYVSLREIASRVDAEDLSMIGQGRWFLDWHSRHRFCANCGNETEISEGGAKRVCGRCKAEHFPRTDPVAIVLAIHEGSCLLGRGPHFPPGFLSALAGFVEGAETPEECAIRELREEAGVELTQVDYKFSQPWPFPSSMMMGFIAQAASKDVLLDENEIVEAQWFTRDEVNDLRHEPARGDVMLPPEFTIARQLINLWADTD